MDFNCFYIYVTPAGHRRQFRCRTTAVAADLAVEIGERILRNDKRRSIAKVVYSEAISR